MSWLFGIHVPLLILGLVTVQLLRTAFKPGLRDLPGPFIARFTRLWNISSVVGGKLHDRALELHEKYGPIVRVGPNHVALCNSAHIPLIYGINTTFTKTHFYTLFSLETNGELNYDLFSTLSPSIHKQKKRAVSNSYAMSSMLSLEPMVDECVNILLQRCEQVCAADNSIDLGKWLQWYAFDVIGEITFSKRFGFMEEGKDVHSMIEQIEGGLIYGAVIGQVPEFHKLLLGNKFVQWVTGRVKTLRDKNPIHFILPFVENQIAQHSAPEMGTSKSSGDFLARLRLHQEAHPSDLTDRDIFVHCLTNLLAGSDTTGISLRAIIYMLLKNPHCYRKLRDEIDDLEAKEALAGVVSFSQSLSMPYLQAVMKESMRLHPAVGFPLERYVPAGGAVIGEHRLPAGTIVGMNAWVIHRNKDIFGEDALSFRPERWIDADEETLKSMNRAFLAFGHGSRTCIGKNISILEMSKLIPQLLRKFDIEMMIPGSEWKLQDYWFVRQTGLICKLTPRVK